MPVLMVSGGLDSYLASHKLSNAQLVFVNYGQPYVKIEAHAVTELYGGRVTIVQMGPLPGLSSDTIHIPARNLLLATIGVRFSPEIYLAGVIDELCSDKSPGAFAEMSRLISKHSNYKVKVDSPFWRYTKDAAVADYLKSGGDPEMLKKTVSCYNPGATPCNECESCFRRAVALLVNGIQVEPPGQLITKAMLRRLHTFEPHRRWAIISALRAGGARILRVDADVPGIIQRQLAEMGKLPDYVIATSSRPAADRSQVIIDLDDRHIDYDALLMEHVD